MKKKLYSKFIALITLSLFSISISGQVLPGQGDLIISEFMANPAAASDTKGEWFELMNISDKAILLTGIIIKDGASNKFEIEGENPVILPSGGFFLTGRSDSPDENGGIFPDYICSNFTLSNTEDEIIVCLPDGTVIDQVLYNSDWQIKKGVSLELDPSFMNSGFNNDISRWKLATEPYGSGDLGSPGAANSSSTSIYNQDLLDQLNIFPNPCFGNLNIDLKLLSKVPLVISLVNIAGQEIIIFESNHCDELMLQFDTESLQKGVWMVRFNIGSQSVLKKVLLF